MFFNFLLFNIIMFNFIYIKKMFLGCFCLFNWVVILFSSRLEITLYAFSLYLKCFQQLIAIVEAFKDKKRAAISVAAPNKRKGLAGWIPSFTFAFKCSKYYWFLVVSVFSFLSIYLSSYFILLLCLFILFEIMLNKNGMSFLLFNFKFRYFKILIVSSLVLFTGLIIGLFGFKLISLINFKIVYAFSKYLIFALFIVNGLFYVMVVLLNFFGLLDGYLESFYWGTGSHEMVSYNIFRELLFSLLVSQYSFFNSIGILHKEYIKNTKLVNCPTHPFESHLNLPLHFDPKISILVRSAALLILSFNRWLFFDILKTSRFKRWFKLGKVIIKAYSCRVVEGSVRLVINSNTAITGKFYGFKGLRLNYLWFGFVDLAAGAHFFSYWLSLFKYSLITAPMSLLSQFRLVTMFMVVIFTIIPIHIIFSKCNTYKYYYMNEFYVYGPIKGSNKYVKDFIEKNRLCIYSFKIGISFISLVGEDFINLKHGLVWAIYHIQLIFFVGNYLFLTGYVTKGFYGSYLPGAIAETMLNDFSKTLYLLNQEELDKKRKTVFKYDVLFSTNIKNDNIFLGQVRFKEHFKVNKLFFNKLIEIELPEKPNLLVYLSNYSMGMTLPTHSREFKSLFIGPASLGFFLKLNGCSIIDSIKSLKKKYKARDTFWDGDLNFLRYNISGFNIPDVGNLTRWMFVDASDLPLSMSVVVGTLMLNNVTTMANPRGTFNDGISKAFGFDLNFDVFINFCGSFILLYFVIGVLMCWVGSTYAEGYLFLLHNFFIEGSFGIAWVLFIISEVMLFAGFFAGFFYSSEGVVKTILSHCSTMDDIFLYKGSLVADVNIQGINPFNLPFVNTLILVASGTIASGIVAIVKLVCGRIYLYLKSCFLKYLDSNNLIVTLYNNLYYSIGSGDVDNELETNYDKFNLSADNHGGLSKHNLNLKQLFESCLVLGAAFMCIQGIEYYGVVVFSIFEGILPSYFFVVTGFHGAHVLIGIIMLGFSYKGVSVSGDTTQAKATLAGINLYPNSLSFDLPIWYWNFVDMVWVFVWTVVYQVVKLVTLSTLAFALNFKIINIIHDFDFVNFSQNYFNNFGNLLKSNMDWVLNLTFNMGSLIKANYSLNLTTNYSLSLDITFINEAGDGLNECFQTIFECFEIMCLFSKNFFSLGGSVAFAEVAEGVDDNLFDYSLERGVQGFIDYSGEKYHQVIINDDHVLYYDEFTKLGVYGFVYNRDPEYCKFLRESNISIKREVIDDRFLLIYDSRYGLIFKYELTTSSQRTLKVYGEGHRAYMLTFKPRHKYGASKAWHHEIPLVLKPQEQRNFDDSEDVPTHRRNNGYLTAIPAVILGTLLAYPMWRWWSRALDDIIDKYNDSLDEDSDSDSESEIDIEVVSDAGTESSEESDEMINYFIAHYLKK